MRIIVDTNIAFSAILNTNSMIASILLQPRSSLHFYAPDLLLIEIDEHKDKLRTLTDYTEYELNSIINLITSKIRFINSMLIPPYILLNTQDFLIDIDVDDTEFVALTTHISGKLWSGDKKLLKGLIKKGWKKYITTDELHKIINKK